MSEESKSYTYSLNLLPPLTVVVFILLALTGNCQTCGFERDYIGDAIDARNGGETP